MRKYTHVIMNINDITPEMIGICSQTSLDTLRKNNESTHGILKWPEENDTPTSIVALSLTEYSNEEIKTLINNEVNGWIPDELDLPEE